MIMTTVLDMRTFLERLHVIMDLDYERDPDTIGGYVAQIPGAGQSEAVEAVMRFKDAGFSASWSQDDDGQYFVWVCIERDIEAE